MKKVKLITAWEANREKDFYVPYHSHDFYELVLYDYGLGTTRIDGQLYEFSEGCFALITPNTEHDEVHTAEGKVFCLGFSIEENLKNQFYGESSRAVEGIIRTIVEETLHQNLAYKDMIEAKLNELIVILKRLFSGQPQKLQSRSFEYVINYLAENSHEKIVLKDLATQLNFSYDYFQHHFKELVGVSPQQFLINKRVEMAGRLLQEGQLSCTEIAYRCGFSNSAQFSYIFKRETGKSPKNVLSRK